MNVSPLSLLERIDPLSLAIAAFTIALTWPAMMPVLRALPSKRTRTLAFTGLGVVLLLGTVPLYLVPGLLINDDFSTPMAIMVAAMWMIAVAALVIRGLLLRGTLRLVSLAFAVVAATGLLVGFVASLYARHDVPDTITPTGAFLLATAAIAGLVFWSNNDTHVPRRA